MRVAQKIAESRDHEPSKHAERCNMIFVTRPDNTVDIAFFSAESGVYLETFRLRRSE